MPQAPLDPTPMRDPTPLRSIVAAWAVALFLLAVGELFVSFHNRIEHPFSNAPSPMQRAATEDALAW